jgi:hypothetical protein
VSVRQGRREDKKNKHRYIYMYERNGNETFKLKLFYDNTALCAMKSNLRLT